MLVTPTRQQHQRFVVGTHGGDGALGRCGDGIVDKGDPMPAPHHFHAMRDALELGGDLAYGFQAGTREARGAGSRQQIRQIVHALQAYVLCRTDHPISITQP